MKNILHISLTVLLSLSGITFAIAEGSPLAGLSLVIALATLFFVDLEEIFSVPAWIANSLGLLAFIFAGQEFFSGELEARLLAGGHLIVYLTWVFLIQKKKVRHFWWLCALSILQIATASVLTDDIWFGFALVLYSFVATWTLSVFLLYRSTLLNHSDSEQDSDLGSTFIVGDTWKGISRDADHRLLNWRFITINGTMTCLGLFLSFLFFVFTPRIWIGQFSFLSDEAMSRQALTGFTEEVSLGDMGEIMESDEVVVELQLVHPTSNRAFTPKEYDAYLGAEPLFRGTVMEIYDKGRWKQFPGRNSQRFYSSSRDQGVIQKFKVHAIGSDALFSFGNAYYARAFGPKERVIRERFSNELKRGSETPLTHSFEYEIQASQGPYTPQSLYYYRFYMRDLDRIPANMSRTAELAESLVVSAKTDLEKANLLQNYFMNADEFSYSLNLSIQDASIDPIEDFLFNRKSGHCEYYASSMAMMLRAVGIPSRVAGGFKGGKYDKSTKSYLIQQFHAHSWVEAYIDEQWYTFDPTPATRSLSVQEQENSSASFLKGIKAKALNIWSTGATLSQRQQRAMIYDPIKEVGMETWGHAKNIIQGRTSSLKGLLEFLKSPEEWFSLQGGLFAFVLMLLASGFVWLTKRVLPVIKKFRAKSLAVSRRREQVEFYDRFLKILSRHGIQQSPTQTAREFVNSSLLELKPKLQSQGLEGWPTELVSAFYDVRFGGLELPEPLASEIDQRLTLLESCLQEQKEKPK
ncbi:transglutaminase TgpA family protein [Thalassoglobus sp.]|uniref:transglutaminase TgpA family protein n=1 Tax=Thalassoglobus sp. TaxID=2795869 RepID=UPI003AA90818